MQYVKTGFKDTFSCAWQDLSRFAQFPAGFLTVTDMEGNTIAVMSSAQVRATAKAATQQRARNGCLVAVMQVVTWPVPEAKPFQPKTIVRRKA